MSSPLRRPVCYIDVEVRQYSLAIISLLAALHLWQVATSWNTRLPFVCLLRIAPERQYHWRPQAVVFWWKPKSGFPNFNKATSNDWPLRSQPGDQGTKSYPLRHVLTCWTNVSLNTGGWLAEDSDEVVKFGARTSFFSSLSKVLFRTCVAELPWISKLELRLQWNQDVGGKYGTLCC